MCHFCIDVINLSSKSSILLFVFLIQFLLPFMYFAQFKYIQQFVTKFDSVPFSLRNQCAKKYLQLGSYVISIYKYLIYLCNIFVILLNKIKYILLK